MKRIMAYATNILLIICMIFVSFFNFPNVNAKTVNDLKRELDVLQRQAKENKDKIKYTENQINQARNDIKQINIDMDNISNEIITKNKEIENLNEEIKNKDAETKQLMEFVQLSNGYSFYLEYVMGAESLTDLIYRMSVTEQLSEYNSKLIVQMSDMIKANEARKIELNNKTIELDKKQEELAVNLKILASEKIKLDENERSLEDELANARDVINMYKEAGCGDNEDINACASRLLPSDTRFWRPFDRGVVTSEFGYRASFGEYHYAIDVSNSGTTKVYAVANGKVAKVIPYINPVTGEKEAGGNQVIIQHKIIRNGTIKYYSSTYCHLASIAVKDSQIVSKDTVIGIMGSTGKSTGPHTHLAISNGLRYKDYVKYSDYIAHSFDPRIVINFPPKGVYWYDRVTKY